jgi:hypothetical protein
MLALSAWPASATVMYSKVHSFSIPGLPGVSAWGSYYKTGTSVSVTVCVKDTSKDIDLATAIAIASDKSYRGVGYRRGLKLGIRDFGGRSVGRPAGRDPQRWLANMYEHARADRPDHVRLGAGDCAGRLVVETGRLGRLPLMTAIFL